MNTRIKIDMTVADILKVMAKEEEGEGFNPGALNVGIAMLKHGSVIDPDSFMGGLANMLDLDVLGLYGSKIWMLYKDVCGEDVGKTIAVLRASQLGFLDSDTLKKAIDNYGEGLDLDGMIAKVQAELPDFSITARA